MDLFFSIGLSLTYISKSKFSKNLYLLYHSLLFFKVEPKPHNWTGRGYGVKPCKVKFKIKFFFLP